MKTAKKPIASFKTLYHHEEVERAIGYKFKKPDLLRQALTHSSAKKSRQKNYERLEFIGDRIVNFYISKMLLAHDKKAKEGDLARRYNVLVKTDRLAEIARDINLGKHLIMSASEAGSGGRNKNAILADVIEAIVGAVWMDSGITKAGKVVERLFKHLVPKSASMDMDDDYKSRVQAKVQSKGAPAPNYVSVGRAGPDHSPIFKVRIDARGYKSAYGQGRNKKSAEQDAAKNFLASNR